MCENVGALEKCKNAGTVEFDVAYAAFSIGGIASIANGTISECASIGNININNTNGYSFGYVGGIAGQSSSLSLAKSYAMFNATAAGTYRYAYAGGLVGVWQGAYTLQDNAYLYTEIIPHGLYIYNGWNYTPYDRGDGMFEKYAEESEIKQLEIYW